MFFPEESLGALRKKAVLRLPPPVPETGWRPPASFPNLSAATVIALDTETKETDFDHGPGWARGKGHIVGVSLAAEDRLGNRGQWYFPVRHEHEPEYNLPPERVFPWLQSVLETQVDKVGANLIYDVGHLLCEGIEVKGPLHDVQFAEALLDDEAMVNLEALSNKYIGKGKDTSLLYQWMSEAYGGPVSSKQRENIWRTSPRLVGPYAETDASNPLDVIKKQIPLLVGEELYDLYRMECMLIMLLVKMRRSGVRVDMNAAEQLYVELGRDITSLYQQLYAVTGMQANVNSGADLARIFDKFGIKYPRTDKGAPSFRKEWLAGIEHPIADLINDIRGHEKVRNTFVKGYLLESSVNGRVYCQFHPLRGDASGTITGRFSSSDPNLQNIPVRTAMGKKVRKAFVPDDGHLCWEKNDHSQIEYRMLAHNAVGPGSDALRAEYNADPKTDYHNKVFQSFCPYMGWDYATMSSELKKERRRPLKNVNFGLIYGQSEKSLAYKAGMEGDAAKGFFAAYHDAAPYVKPTMKSIGQEVQRFGYIRTVLNRRVRFKLWEPMNEYGKPALLIDQAIRMYGPQIRRAGEYKGVNYKLQGSAADALKVGMVKCYESGVFDFIGYPKLQVHDELDFSVIDDSPQQQEAYRFMRHTLETAVPTLRVPLVVDSGRGKNWGDID